MITAAEAKELTLPEKENKKEQEHKRHLLELEQVSQKIKEEATKGNDSVYIGDKYLTQTVSVLKENGFSVYEYYMNKFYTRISW